MGRYRKLPVTIDAVQFTGHNLDEIKEFCDAKLDTDPNRGDVYYTIMDSAWEVGKGPPFILLLIKTLEGTMRVSDGDYIIRGVDGEYYPCKPHIFNKTYEKVDD